MLINDKIVAYIEDVGLSDGYQALSGEILALEPVGADGFPSGTSQYGETLLAFSRQAVEAESVTILQDGSDGGAAVVRVSGQLSNIPFLTEGFGALLNQEYGIPAAIDYVLQPDAEKILVRLSLMNPSDQMADLSQLQTVGFFHSSLSQRFTPEFGYAVPAGSVHWVGFDNLGASFAFRWLGGPLSFVLRESGFELYRMSGLRLAACESKSLDYAEWTVSGPGIDSLRSTMRRASGGDVWRQLQGRVKESDGSPISSAYVHVRSASGSYLTRVVTNHRGEFAVRIPVEPVEFVVTQGGFTISAPIPITAVETRAELTVPQNGRLVIHVRDARSKAALPSRIQVIPDENLAPIPSEFGIEQQHDGQAVVEFTPNGEATIPLRPGPHRVLVSRGFEWEILDQRVAITAGKDTQITAELLHSVDSPGVMCADFHIHSQYSADSSDPVPFKIRSAVADGLEIPVSSEHEWIIDFQPYIEQLGLARWAFGFSSEEFTTFTWGHFGIVPIKPRPDQVNNGALQWTGKRPPEVLRSIATLEERPVLIVNHPRSAAFSAGYFTVANLQRSTGQGDPELWSNEFEAIEVFNNSDFEHNRQETVADWFALLNHGKRVWAVGGSDNHSVSGSPVGYPRTCLRFGHDDPQRLSAEIVRDALRAGEATVSGGLYMTVVGPGGSGPGGGVPTPDEAPEFRIVVQAPRWLEARQLEVIVNGETERTLELVETAGGPARRYEATVMLSPRARITNWVVFHAKAEGRDLGPIYPGRRPFAVSNPIFF